MDSYLRGVVPRESFASWPQQALRAQTIAARSYAAYHRAHRTAKVYDLDDGESFQVYGGFDDEERTTDEAVAATAGKILTYGGEPAFTEFGSSNGGWTVAGDAPYLQAREDPWDRTEKWQVRFTDDELEAAWPSIGNLTQVAITGRDGNGEWGGRAGSVTLTGSGGSVTVSATAFRVKLGLRSTWLTLTVS
jgi:stage II sporulation protein D